MMKIQKKKGISLIVLVIAIVIMIILAAAILLSLKANGVFSRAEEARKSTEIANVKERALIDIQNWQMARNGIDTTVNTPEMVQQILNDANTEENRYYSGFTDTGITTPSGYELAYEELYNAKIGMISKPVEELVVGDRVYYDTGNTSIGNEGIIECTVLYDKAYNEENGTNYGVQIISSDIIKDSNGNTVKVTFNGTGFNKMQTVYNNALTTLYNKAQEYLNDTYVSSARCVGSDPADPDWDDGYYTKEIAEEKGEYKSFLDSYYGKLKNMDEKYITDFTQMDKIESKITTDSYWLASRDIVYTSEELKFRFKIRYLSVKSGNVSRRISLHCLL